MRRVFSGILAAVIVLSMCTAAASAAGPGTGRYFVDADGNGICDNYVPGQGRGFRRGTGAQGGRGGNFVDVDGDGVCDNCVLGQGRGGCGANFVDADGDGVCDNYVLGQGRGGCGNGFRCGRGR